MSGGIVDSLAHIEVTWGNAISRDSITCCYGDLATALRDAWNPGLGLWNNTRVEVFWHPSHAGSRRRDAESSAHRPKYLWQQCACGPGQCSLPARHAAQAHAEITAAAAAAGFSSPPGPGYEGHLIARIPEHPGRQARRPGPGVLSAPRCGLILLTGRTDAGRIDRLAGLLRQDLAGTVTVEPRGGTVPKIASPAARHRLRPSSPGSGITPGPAG